MIGFLQGRMLTFCKQTIKLFYGYNYLRITSCNKNSYKQLLKREKNIHKNLIILLI